jgi:hypothetical protein
MGNTNHFWKVTSCDLREGEKPGQLLCAVVTRCAPSARIELLVPMALTAFLAIFAPFFGSFRYQTGIKILALVLQYICMQQFVTKTVNKQFGDGLPNILLFQEFVMVTTLVSLVVTLILWTIRRVQHFTPPPNRLLGIAERINNVLFCTSFSEGDEDELIDSSDEAGKQNATLKQQWDSTVQCLNNAFFILFAIIYCIGMLALCIP